MSDQSIATRAPSDATLVATTGSQFVHVLDLARSERSYRVARCGVTVGDELRDGDERLYYPECAECFGVPAAEDEAAAPLDEAAAKGIERQHAQRKRASDAAEGLRALARMLEENPELMQDACYLNSLDVWWSRDPERLAAIVRAGMRYGAKVDKQISERQHNVLLTWGPIGARAIADRELVCERVVVGTERVVKKVPDPVLLAAIPEVEVVEDVDRVEWKCRPLLAAESEAGA